MNKLEKSNLLQLCNWNDLNKVAIEYTCDGIESMHITYAQINEDYKAIKQLLNDIEPAQFIGISSDVPIFCMPTLMLGIISSGHAFVYLTKDSQLLSDSLDIKYTFYCKENVHTFNGVITNVIIHAQQLLLYKITTALTANNVPAKNNDKQPNYFAYAVTTTGSTGTPAVVKVTHASIIPNIVELSEILKLTSNDKIAQLTPLTFDPSIVDIFVNFYCGCTLFTASNKLINNPSKLLMSLYNKQVTLLSTTPSLLLHRWSSSDLQATLLGKNSKLVTLLLGGELFPMPEILRRIKHQDNHTRIFNIYGITQVSCWASINEVKPNMTINPADLGVILNNTIFQVRNNNNEIITEGIGVLFIGSYTRICVMDNEKLDNLKLPIFRNTGDVVLIKKNGELNFKGRQDSCIKRFGTKVYINDLKYHLDKLNFIKDSTAVWFDKTATLHLFFTVLPEFSNIKNKLLTDTWLHVKQLPDILQPDDIHLLDEFKINRHGKICKTTLKKFKRKIINNISSHFETLWQNHLPIINNANDYGFVDAGGTSLMALEITTKLTNDMNKEFPELIGMLLENKTRKMCEKYIEQHYNGNNLTDVSCQIVTYIETNNTTRTIDKSVENICLWQKCKGTTLIQQPVCDINSSLKLAMTAITVENLYNLNKCVDASPTLFKYTNEKIYITVGGHSGIICTVDMVKNTWQVQLPDRIEASLLVLDNFKSIIGCHDSYLYCINLKTGEIYWKFKTGNIIKCLAVLCSKKQNIFIGSYDRFLYCINIENGALVWKRKATSIRTTPLIHENTNSVIFTLLDGYCISVQQSNGKIRWKYKLSNAIFSTPAILHNKIIVLADVYGNFTGLNVQTGIKLWDFSITAHVFADLVIHKHDSNCTSLIVASKNGFIYRYDFDNDSPNLKFKINCNGSIVATPWVNNSIIVVACETGDLRIIDVTNGMLLSNFKLDGGCFSSPVVHENFLAIGCRDNNLYILTFK